MRTVVLLAAITLAACGSDPANMGDDAPPADAAPDAPGPGCWGLSPRTTPAEAFVGPTGLQNRLNAIIDGAQTSLDVQMYLFTVQALADRLIAAKNRGVAVRVLLDPDHEGNATVRTKLTQASVPTRNAPTLYSFSHAKYLVVDKKQVVIMSMNFNVDAMNNERNYGMITRDADDIADSQAIFDMDWAAGAGEPPKPADLACTRLVVSPNNAKARLTDFINSAKTTLDVEAMYISEQGVQTAIIDAKKRGVTVRVIVESSADTQEVRNLFIANGITVKVAGSFYLHAKLLIADGVAFVGSENFSITALTKNRELGAFVFEPAAAQVIQQQFDTDWTASN
jgi:phosphatidylserine/phosphatidylglycerophosphate/cardiolipin synthase-like enzyme